MADDIMDMEQFIERMRARVNAAFDSFVKDWPGDLLPCGQDEWMERLEKHCEKNNFFGELPEIEDPN